MTEYRAEYILDDAYFTEKEIDTMKLGLKRAGGDLSTARFWCEKVMAPDTGAHVYLLYGEAVGAK